MRKLSIRIEFECLYLSVGSKTQLINSEIPVRVWYEEPKAEHLRCLCGGASSPREPCIIVIYF